MERTIAWQDAVKKLVLSPERRETVVRFYLAFANVAIIVRRLVREAW